MGRGNGSPAVGLPGEAGMDGFLTKPVDLDSILSELFPTVSRARRAAAA